MPDRRSVVSAAALGLVAVPLAGCGGAGKPTASPFSSPAQPDPSTPGSPGSKPSNSSGPKREVAPLIEMSEVPVGGAAFLNAVDVPGEPVEKGVVVTQPTKGDFHAFSRDCSHAHCAVSDLRDGNIHCFCHDSLFDLESGGNVGGPAPTPLTRLPIKVKGDAIFRA